MSNTLAKVNDAIKNLATKFQEAITFDDDGAATIPETFVKDNLATASGDENMTIEQVKLIQNTEATFTCALALGLGNSSLELMSKNKSIDRTTASVEFGNDMLRASVDREMTIRVPTTSEERIKYGHTSVKLESGAAAKRGELKHVIVHVGENFAAKFGK